MWSPNRQVWVRLQHAFGLFLQAGRPRPRGRVLILRAVPQIEKVEPINIHENTQCHLQQQSNCRTSMARNTQAPAYEQTQPKQQHLFIGHGNCVQHDTRRVEDYGCAGSVHTAISARTTPCNRVLLVCGITFVVEIMHGGCWWRRGLWHICVRMHATRSRQDDASRGNIVFI
jgi:hypothetical protein